MKILYFTRGQSPHDLRFINSLAATEHHVAVLTLEPTDLYSWSEGVQRLTWPASDVDIESANIFRLARYFKQIVSDFQPDVIHAGPIQRVAYIAALAGVGNLLSMSWGSDILLEANQNLGWRWRTRFTLNHSQRLAADCLTVVKKARRFGYAGPVSVFPWGVDLTHFCSIGSHDLRNRLGWHENCVFLCNRTMEELYGVNVVARAFAQASRQNEQIRLLLFGSGSQEAQIHAILSDAEKTDRVYFGGRANLAELPDIYRSADVYVSASHSDGSSVSLMEALACGIPALVSDIPSNQEWVTPGQQGWLFADGNVRTLAEQMLQIPEQRDVLAFMSVQARRLAEDKADWKKNFAILLEAYQLVKDGPLRLNI
jgi:glycosyltransferase involved in cell wall biosynthesis